MNYCWIVKRSLKTLMLYLSQRRMASPYTDLSCGMFVHNYARLDMNRWNIFVAVSFKHAKCNVDELHWLYILQYCMSTGVAVPCPSGKCVFIPRLCGHLQPVWQTHGGAGTPHWRQAKCEQCCHLIFIIRVSYVFAYQRIKHPSS